MPVHLRAAAERLVAVATTAVLTNRELGNLPDFLLSFGWGKRSSDQSPVEWTVVTADPLLILRGVCGSHRLFRRLHAHGLIAKIPHSRRWRISLFDRRIMAAALKIREVAYPSLYADAA